MATATRMPKQSRSSSARTYRRRLPAAHRRHMYGRVLHSGRPYLGIATDSVTPTLQQRYGLPVSNGVLVTGLAANGPAQQADLRSGDVIVQINTTAIAGNIALITALAPEQPGAGAGERGPPLRPAP